MILDHCNNLEKKNTKNNFEYLNTIRIQINHLNILQLKINNQFEQSLKKLNEQFYQIFLLYKF